MRNKKYWLLVLMAAVLVCVLVLMLVVSRINVARSNLAHSSPGAFNYLLQSTSNIDAYVDSLRKAQDTNGDVGVENELRRKYQQNFDVVWGGFSVFEINFAFQPELQKQVSELIELSTLYLTSNEHLMEADYKLSNQETDELIAGARVLTEKTVKIGHEYFIYATHLSNQWHEDIQHLYQLFWVCALSLLLTGSLLISLLLISNKRSSELIKKSSSTQLEMKRLIDELRSGKLENKAKDSFIAAASHDLRQPLHALGLFLGATEKHIDNEAGLQSLAEAKHCAEELNKLFNSLLDLSRLDAGVVEVNKKEFKLNRLLSLMEQEFSVKARQRGIDFGVSQSLVNVNTDALLLNRILRNLLENALNHSGATEVFVSVEQKARFARVTVADNGVGIPLDEQTDIFSEYYQLGNPERDRSKGLGLGLSIVKRLCEILDVNITLESSGRNGTLFHLDVPAGSDDAAPEVESVVHQAGEGKPVTGALIAVIDDDAIVRRSMILILESLNFKTVATESADTMITALRSQGLTPDLLVADYRLRENQTGDVAIHQVRSAFKRDIPAMLITGDTSPGRMNEAANSGFDLLHKPVEPTELKLSINRLIRVSSTLQPEFS